MVLRSDLLFKLLMILMIPTVLGFTYSQEFINGMEKVGDGSYIRKNVGLNGVYIFLGTLYSYFLFLIVTILTLFGKLFSDRARGAYITDYGTAIIQWIAKILIALIVLGPIILSIILAVNILQTKFELSVDPLTKEEYITVKFKKDIDYYYIKNTYSLIPIIYGCLVVMFIFSSPGCNA